MAAKPLTLALTLLCLASPVAAKDKPKEAKLNLQQGQPGAGGSVALFDMAQGLFALAVATKDPLAALTAAKLAGSLDFVQTDREKSTKGPERAPADDPHTGPVGTATMLATARDFAGEDETMLAAIELVEREAGHGRIGSVASTRSTLGAGKVDSWNVPLFADTVSEIGVVGDGDTNLDVTVTDENGNVICMDVSGSDRIYCRFTPAWNGAFTVTVQNLGEAPNSYFLLTN